MLRTLFVLLLLIIGCTIALRGPLYALLLYVWLAYFRPEQWVWTSTFQTLNLSFFAGIYLVIRTLFSPVRWRMDLRSLLLFSLLVHSGISSWLSADPAWTFVYYRDFVKSTIITYLISVLAFDYKSLRLIVLVMGLSLSFEGAKQGWAQMVFNPGATNTNPIFFLGDNNYVAVGVLMMVPLLVTLARTAPTRWERWLHTFLVVGMLYRSISTYSRGGFLAAIALGVVYVARSDKKLRAIAGAAIAATLVLSVMPDTFWERMQTITEGDAERDGSSTGRLHFWGVAVTMARDNPIFGVGHNGFTVAYDRYDPTAAEFGRRRAVHSMWMGTLAELGFVGLGLFAALLWLAWRACRQTKRLAKLGRLRPELGQFAVGLETAFFVCAVGGTFVSFQYVEMLWHFVGLSMALHTISHAAMAEPAFEGSVASRPAPSVARMKTYGSAG
jgi:probable O-glycosylation ligase (exosortase A-associated)